VTLSGSGAWLPHGGYVIRVPPRVPGRDTGPVRGTWVHIGRLWTNGEPFLAVDAAIRRA